MPVEPIKPAQVTEHLVSTFPDHVIETWNGLIAKAVGSGHYGTIQQQEARDALIEGSGDPTSRPYDMKWLDIEDVYRQQGWIVTYNKSPYYDTSDSYFVFEKPQKG